MLLRSAALIAAVGGLAAADLRLELTTLPTRGNFSSETTQNVNEDDSLDRTDVGRRIGLMVRTDLDDPAWYGRPVLGIGAAWQRSSNHTPLATHDRWALSAEGELGWSVGYRIVELEVGGFSGIGFAEGSRTDLTSPSGSAASSGQGWLGLYGLRAGLVLTVGSWQVSADVRRWNQRTEVTGNAASAGTPTQFSDREKRFGTCGTIAAGYRF
jgi:hypothetical protein